MPVRMLGLITVLLLVSGCSILFNPAAEPEEDGSSADCTSVDTCDTQRADRCFQGLCICGTGPECGEGALCVNGACVCDSNTCSGCCAGTTCQTGNEVLFCGSAGNMCTSCDLSKADNCGDECLCGSELQCGDGLRCSGGQCVCDDTSCIGCCTEVGVPGAECLDGTDGTNCGNSGGSCSNCGADSCTEGVCEGCVTDCVNLGCCSGSTCIVAQPGATACGGTLGGACMGCGIAADGCNEQGECSCGIEGRACNPGQECTGEACRCTPESCPNGCCDGTGQCSVAVDNACGVGGGICNDCTIVGGTCNGGQCDCEETACPLP